MGAAALAAAVCCSAPAAGAQPALVEQAVERYLAKDYGGAATAARQALETQPKDASALHIYGLALAGLHQFAEA
ncbi:MAG: hypothetical protein DMG07_26560, partial [Acidobacteria bacterium]